MNVAYRGMAASAPSAFLALQQALHDMDLVFEAGGGRFTMEVPLPDDV